MKKKIRNMFPGGNTPKGFYSYYDQIISQYEANRIFCIKGGPGTGKSTMMKDIGRYFAEKGESVEFMRCSSDPDSLDGVVMKERGVAVLDGTEPHVTDPVNPGAVDEIVDLGKYWDEEGLKMNRGRIIESGNDIREAFDMAYVYLECAEKKYDIMSRLLEKIISPEEIRELKHQLDMKIDGVSAVRRAENKIVRGLATGKAVNAGKCRKLFAGAITSEGIKSELLSVIEGGKKIIAVDVPAGFRTEHIMKPVSDRLREASFDVVEYYCPMDPEKKLEHIVCPEIGLAVITCNRYHFINDDDTDQRMIKISLDIDHKAPSVYSDVYEDLQERSRDDIDRSLRYFTLAKTYHDELEDIYISYMDFEKIDEVKNELIRKIES